jgi:PAS domain S-box-containing protein
MDESEGTAERVRSLGKAASPFGGADGAVDLKTIQRIADILPVMIAFVDRDLVYRFVNESACDWFAKPRHKIIGHSIEQVVGEKAAANRRPLLKQALGGERMLFTSEFEHPTRGPAAVQTEYVPWTAENGEVHGVLILFQDVTEQRQAEQAIRESEERFRRIANSAPVMMWVTRLDRVRDFVNDAYVLFVGGPNAERDDVRTIDWRTRIHPDDVDRIVKESIAGEERMEAFALEGRYLRHDGEWRWLRSVSQPRIGADGRLSGFIGVASDITLAKEAEIELRREVEQRSGDLIMSEARFRSVFDTVLEVLVLMEPDGTIVEVNRKQTAWRAPNARAAIGKKIWDAPTLAIYPQHKALLKRAVKAAAAGEIFTHEAKMEREGAETAHLDISVQPVHGPDGNILYLLFEARDVTDLKVAQEQLRQSQKMEALGQLTGGIAHDFNNLLTVVVGGLDIIAKKIDEPKLKRYADNALNAAERGARLTGQLLAFSRVQRLEVRPTEISKLVEDMRPMMRNVLGPGIAKKFELDEAAPPVMADPTQVEVALLNLAINARDAMPKGGTLTFASKVRNVLGSPDLADGDYVELSISDTGEGMPAEIAERAFEPFFTTKEVGKGTGLGLSMVYGMARQSGGTARIASRPGKGTRVSLLFRAAHAAETVAAPREEEPVGGDTASARKSVLVIDDDADVRTFMATALKDQGYSVREAATGPAGVAAAKRTKPDLVIIDYIMPILSGAEVARRILKANPGQKILFVSGYSETEAVRSAAPGSPLLSKPFRADTLQKTVSGILSGQA